MPKLRLLTLVSLVLATIVGKYLPVGRPATTAAAEDADSSTSARRPEERVRVFAVKARRGGIARTTTQPCSVIPDKCVELFAKAPGYLKALNVDIGSHVNEGDVLAVIDSPELHKETARCEASLKLANAAVGQAEARLITAKAEWEAAKALTRQLAASAEDAKSMHSYRTKVFDRLKELAETQKAIDMKLVDEKEEHMYSAAARLNAANAAVFSAESQESAARAKIDEAEADCVSAVANVKACSAQLEKARVLAGYTTISSPYTGVVTARNFWPGDFIQTRIQGAALPLLVVEKTDVMRIKVHVPDADVPFVEPGDTATIVIDALPGKRFPATVSRVAGAEDPGTRTMRVEIDLRNEHGLFHDGMYGRATICLDDELSSLNVPSSFVVEKTEAGVGSLFVLRDGIARKTRVRLGEDDARRTVILNGLQASDWLIAPGPDVTDGTRVTITKRDGDRKEP